jgi:hypothetical protein
MTIYVTPTDLTDEEIEECIDGSSDVSMIREIMSAADVYDDEDDVLINEENFATRFAHTIEGFIDADAATPEWQEAWDINYEWALTIAENINKALIVELGE